jgi:hypothetical protein
MAHWMTSERRTMAWGYGSLLAHVLHGERVGGGQTPDRCKLLVLHPLTRIASLMRRDLSARAKLVASPHPPSLFELRRTRAGRGCSERAEGARPSCRTRRDDSVRHRCSRRANRASLLCVNCPSCQCVAGLSACVVGQITTMLSHIPPRQEGRIAIVTTREAGMRWPRQSCSAQFASRRTTLMRT